MARYTPAFVPADGESEIHYLGTYDHPIGAFRCERLPKNLEWGFDGDCWYTPIDHSFGGVMGGFAVFWDE